MSREEKMQLHELLGKYIDELELEERNKRNPYPKTKNDFAILVTIQNHIKIANEIRETLVYDF